MEQFSLLVWKAWHKFTSNNIESLQFQISPVWEALVTNGYFHNRWYEWCISDDIGFRSMYERTDTRNTYLGFAFSVPWKKTRRPNELLMCFKKQEELLGKG